MPKHYSNLKSIYKNTYEELTNPNSPIGVFIAKIDRTSVKQPEVIKEAIKEYIKVYEEEEKHIYTVGKGRSILVAFSVDFG